MNSNFINFFAELVNRFTKPSPIFFKVISYASMTAAFITGLPALLTSSGIVLPPDVIKVENSTIAIASLVGLFISKLTVADPSATNLPLTAPKPTGLSAAPNDSTASK